MEGDWILGIGYIVADFHSEGTVDWSRERLMKLARGLEKKGAPRRRNHDGS